MCQQTARVRELRPTWRRREEYDSAFTPWPRGLKDGGVPRVGNIPEMFLNAPRSRIVHKNTKTNTWIRRGLAFTFYFFLFLNFDCTLDFFLRC